MYHTLTRQSSAHLTIPSSSSFTSRILAQSSAKLYHAKFGARENEWQYFNQRGTVLFGRDQSDEEEVVNSAVEGGITAPQNSSARIDDATHWFRLRDESNGRILWMFQIPKDCYYRIDKPFFHIFSGRSRMWGFLFDSDIDGLVFGELVHAYFPSPVPQDSQSKLYKSVGSISKRDSSIRSRTSLRSRFGTRIGNMSTPTLTSSSKKAGLEHKVVTPAMISLPHEQTFAHVGHIGLNGDGVIECAGGIDHTWSNIISDLQMRSPHKSGGLASAFKHKELFRFGIKKLGPVAIRF